MVQVNRAGQAGQAGQAGLAALGAGAGGGGTLLGIACGMGAGALWGLVFLAPQLVAAFAPLEITIGRHLSYGVIAVLLLWPRWKSIAPFMTQREWRSLAWLALAGNTLYYVLLSSAVQWGGIAMTSLVIGFLPVAVTLIGSRERGAVPLGKLWPSIGLCLAGALCIGWQALVLPPATGAAVKNSLMGLVCAIGALISWTLYAVGNSRCLARLGSISAHDWNLLTGTVTGAQVLCLIPVAVLLHPPAQQHSVGAWTHFAAVSVGVAILASMTGNALWNKMSRLLPLTLVGQMILFETLFALLYGFVWEQRWPTLWELAAFVFVALSVLSCVAAHQPRRVRSELVVIG